MSNITAFAKAGLPAVTSLSTALRNIEVDVGPAGTAILKMDKTGHWVFGADQTEAEDGSKWAVNPFSFVHGFIAWGDGEVLGEKMVSVSQPLPELEPAPPQSKKGWETQVGMSLKCISGEDAGLEARYSTTSVGGKRAVQTLAAAIAAQVEKDQSKPARSVLVLESFNPPEQTEPLIQRLGVVGKHAAERMSVSTAAQVGLMASQIAVASSESLSKYGSTIGVLGGAAMQFGVILPYSRRHELEADKLGVDYMHQAGYDVKQSVRLWELMDAQSKGQRPPEFMSTHPDPVRRAEDLRNYINAKGYALM